jgi:hypothetical protein
MRSLKTVPEIKLMKLSAISALVCMLVSACGTTDPSPVGIDLVDLAGGDVVELAELRPSEARSRFREIFPSVLGQTEELLIGRMNGVRYVSLFEMAFDPADLPGGNGSGQAVDSLFVELKILGNIKRGNLGRVIVSLPAETWSESRSFVDTTDFAENSFNQVEIADVVPALVDSTVRIPLPVDLLADAIGMNPTNPVVAFSLTGSGLDEDYLIAVSARDTVGSTNAAELVAYLSGPDGQQVSRAKTTMDTYFAERLANPEPGEILLQTGVFSAGVIRFDLPSIPESATVNIVELTMDFDIDRSFLTSLRLRFERLIVVDGDTTFSVASGNPVNEQIINPTSSPFVMTLDQLLFHGWMTGTNENHGLIINPIFDIVLDLRYEWGLFTNPRLRIVYSLPPSIGAS